MTHSRITPTGQAMGKSAASLAAYPTAARRRSWTFSRPQPRASPSCATAAKMPDGSWVGWTYWYGGGKHGEPEAIDWMEDAYNVEVVEEIKMVTVQTFSRED